MYCTHGFLNTFWVLVVQYSYIVVLRCVFACIRYWAKWSFSVRINDNNKSYKMAVVQEQQKTVEPGSSPHHPWSFLVINTDYSGLRTLWTYIFNNTSLHTKLHDLRLSIFDCSHQKPRWCTSKCIVGHNRYRSVGNGEGISWWVDFCQWSIAWLFGFCIAPRFNVWRYTGNPEEFRKRWRHGSWNDSAAATMSLPMSYTIPKPPMFAS